MAYPPDSMLDVELADELAALVGQLKNQLARHHAAGTWAAPGGATARNPVAADAVTADAMVEEPVVHVGRRTLATIRAELGDCTRCKLHSTRKSIVFGVGDENAPLMFVGE